MNKSPSLGSKISDEKIFDEDAFLENFQLTNDSGMAVQSSSFKPSPVDFGTGTLAIQAMKQLVEIAVDNPQKVCQNMTHKQQIMLCYATQSNNEELQNQVLSLLKILAEYDANYALKLLMVEDGAERNIVHNIMFYGTDQVRILGLQLLIDLIKASGNEAENIQMIHDLLLDEGNDTNDYNPLCHVISRSSIAELAKTKLKVLELLNALPLNNESDVCFVLDLLESRPYEKYKSYLNALAHDCAANISTEIRRLTLQLNRMRNAHATVLTNIKLSDDCVGRIEAILKTV